MGVAVFEGVGEGKGLEGMVIAGTLVNKAAIPRESARTLWNTTKKPIEDKINRRFFAVLMIDLFLNLPANYA
jgi:hypothetical protein